MRNTDYRDPASIPLPPSDDEFEQLCLLIARDRYGAEYYRYGRKGQAQHGIDIFSAYHDGRCLQCKLHKKDISDAELIRELRNDLQKAQHKFVALKQFILAISIETRPSIQDYCKKLSNDNLIITPWFWNQLQEDIARSQWLLRYYLNCVPGASWISDDFVDQELKKGDSEEWQPIHFYSSNAFAQWYGILKNWDAPRQHYQAICQAIAESFVDTFSDMPVAAIVRGEGGSGKSVLLRRIVVNLRNDYTVYWIADNAEDFLNNEWVYDIENNSNEKYLLILEDWYRNFTKTEDQVTANKLLQKVRRKTNVRLLIGDRLSTQVSYPKNREAIFDLVNEENASLLPHIIEFVPGWKEKFSEKQQTQLLRTGLFQLLFVYQHTDTFKELPKAENYFLEIIQSDFKQLCNSDKPFYKGLAYALYSYANIYTEYSLRFSLDAIIAMAESYSGQQLPFELNNEALLENTIIKRYFDIVIRKHGNEDSFQLRFLHDTLAEGWMKIEVDNRRKFGSTILILETLEILKNVNRNMELSAFLSRIRILTPALLNDDKFISICEFLIRSRCDSHHYIQMLFSDKLLEISIEQRLAYIDQIIGLCNENNGFWSPIVGWVNKCISLDKKKKVLKNIVSAGNTCSSVLLGYYEVLNDKELKKVIYPNFNVTNLLNPTYDAIGQAIIKRLSYNKDIVQIIYNYLELASPETSTTLFDLCLRLLKETPIAKKAAYNYLNISSPRNPQILSTCLLILREEPIAKSVALAYLQSKNPESNKQTFTECLYTLHDTEIAKIKAYQYINSFKGDDFDQAWTASLWVLGKDAIDIVANILTAPVEKYPPQILYRAVEIAVEIDSLEKSIERFVQRVIREKYRNAKARYTHLQIMKIPLFHIDSWQKETDVLLSNFKTVNRNLFYSLTISHVDKPMPLTDACLFIIRNWKDEFRIPKRHWAYFIRCLAHPIIEQQSKLQEEIRSLCAEMLIVDECPAKLTEWLSSISKENRFPEWKKLDKENT